MRLVHRLLHGHWPEWEACDYDFLTWRYRCLLCGAPDTEEQP